MAVMEGIVDTAVIAVGLAVRRIMEVVLAAAAALRIAPRVAAIHPVVVEVTPVEVAIARSTIELS